jgi:cytochrome c-type biogenesis protein CcmH/NrfG
MILIGVVGPLVAAALLSCNSSPQLREAKSLKKGVALLAARDYPRALLEFRNASKAMPKDAEPFFQMGLAYLGSGDLAAAARSLQEATQLNPNHAGAQLKLAEIMVNTRKKEFVEDGATRLQTILTKTPENVEAIDTLAIAEWKLGQPGDSTKRLEEALRKFPTHLQSSVVLAKMKLGQNDLAGALEVLQKAVANAPRSPEAALALGQLYHISRQPEKAEAEMKRALQLDPANGPALMGIGAVQVSRGRMEEAEQTALRLSALPDKIYKPLHAMFLFQTGRRDAALAEFLKLAKIDPKDRAARTRVLAA